MPDYIFNLISNVIGGIVIGAFCGVLPLVSGIIKKRVLLGVCAIASCAIVGMILTTFFQLPAFVSILFAVIWTLVIFLQGKSKNEK